MLSAFPFPERDWERDARAVEARLAEGLPAADESLLAAPLPSEADEPSSLSATATPLTNSGVRTQSLAELARRSVEKKQANERQMARESMALAAQQRKLAPASDAPRAAPIVSPVAAIAAVREGVPARTNRLPKVALALPALALAAAALLWFRRPEPAPVVTNVVIPTAPSPAASPVATAVPEVPRGIDPNTLPGEPTPAADPAPPKVAGAPPKVTGGKSPAKDGRPTAPNAPGDNSLPPDPDLRPADSRGGELSAKPSSGAVQAALGAVMSGARHCVAGDDAPSSAVVVFGSDGRVQHVTVSGAAAGKSSASCIEAQLSRARVQPFAASSFSVSATVRPE